MKRQMIIENMRSAVDSIRSQIMRAILTVLIIAFGIMALVAMITATEAIKEKLVGEFSRLGSNTFTVYAKNSRMRMGQQGVKSKKYEPISYHEARDFRELYEFAATTSISGNGSFNAVAKFRSKKTNPNLRILGADEHYLFLSGYEIEKGRNFGNSDISTGANVVIIGKDIQEKIFEEYDDPIDQVIALGDHKYTVVGVLKSKGNMFGMAGDNVCYIPISNLKKNFESASTQYQVNVMVNDPESMDQAIEEANGVLRLVRKDSPGEENSFEIEKSDSLAQQLIEAIDMVSIFGIIIGLITLFGAGIGLMNIMLVSVTERTREIGVRKALGAKNSLIRTQFLIEAIVIGQIGGIVGIIFGILIGNGVSLVLDTPFTIPWGWIMTGVTLCLITSTVSGYYPANKASQLDPIESLRYE